MLNFKRLTPTLFALKRMMATIIYTQQTKPFLEVMIVDIASIMAQFGEALT